MRRLKLTIALAGAIAALLAFAAACASSETPEQPQQPAPAAQPEAPQQPGQQPGAPVQPAQPLAPAPAPTAVMPAASVAEPIIPSTRTTSAPMRMSDADTNIFSEDRFGGTLVWVPQGSVGNLDSMTSRLRYRQGRIVALLGIPRAVGLAGLHQPRHGGQLGS